MAGKDKEESGGALRFLYNSDTGEVLGRTGASWLKITIFYIIFFICLAAFWTVMLVIFYQTLDAFQPKWTLDASLIGTVPGLGFRPRPPLSNIDSTLIYFKAGGSDRDSYKHWVKDLDDFIEKYRDAGNTGEHLTSECGVGRPAGDGKACIIKVDDIYKTNSNCSTQEDYGTQPTKRTWARSPFTQIRTSMTSTSRTRTCRATCLHSYSRSSSSPSGASSSTSNARPGLPISSMTDKKGLVPCTSS
ncbi:sodium/potassium-transporting ATPase subunit beta-like isoform X2 [Varroa jacobsoni]|uniref:sodium/potassium-transporting ATPase subunit beta-like isoform X2 n=1 Tax=Varroa jacobsoni TaxID=62625 RepID=UPI000BF5716D|nr:sodium/potassium-transporting ATPase subunit beta-like isoform X2 [Varroa jacobsoni]